ncbi:fumarylacetoacetate hydrolase family protein [Mycobacterium sp. NAZ190054]|uniref:fumarylacetoacetate hydrolase family protein n=1 Tax=Mycobacterium sp. NAZ190054 TaxID=1747766 RepID=UPI000792C4EE|nr:fumarylacetoacetate hydrolase family protein [Mycobacterium sp. NAZ190054]KWX67329.1 fumarylacetoacetate hydrolase [Mycobacterium sp. NAZ190054]
MKLGTVNNRAVVVRDGLAFDIHQASSGVFGPAMSDILSAWADFLKWAASAYFDSGEPIADTMLGAPVPEPRQIFAVGLNYAEHATESGFTAPPAPMLFTKFQSALCGPDQAVELPDGNVDWEVELVVAIGVGGREITTDDALDHVAGAMVGQDLSERTAQMVGDPPQFSLAKSHPGFAPVGPLLVTLDEIPALDSLKIQCQLNGETVQSASTGDIIFSVPQLISYISHTATLLPGDLIFTGTPPGVGMGRSPARYLSPGDELVSSIDGLGEIRQHFYRAR